MRRPRKSCISPRSVRDSGLRCPHLASWLWSSSLSLHSVIISSHATIRDSDTSFPPWPAANTRSSLSPGTTWHHLASPGVTWRHLAPRPRLDANPADPPQSSPTPAQPTSSSSPPRSSTPSANPCTDSASSPSISTSSTAPLARTASKRTQLVWRSVSSSGWPRPWGYPTSAKTSCEWFHPQSFAWR